MKKSFYLLLIPLLFLMASCAKPYYITNSFKSKTANHKTVAVLPCEMVFTGSKPMDMSKEQLAQLEEAESKAFQTSLYNQILKSTHAGKKQFRVDFQAVSKTNSIFVEQGLSIRDTWTKTPEELATLLNVDAVIRANVEKKRYMSDLASYGINIAKDVLILLGTKNPLAFLGAGSLDDKTNDIKCSVSLIDKEDGTVLWQMADEAEADWDRPSNEVIDNINKRIAKHFPYRVGK